jgi:predicted regulator of Ras-like GTPase activity (Roadblock/LC7/MglB family)
VTALNDLLNEMGQQLRGAWVLAVVDKDGMLIAAWEAPENKLPPELLAGQFVLAIDNMSKTIGQWGEEVEASIGTTVFAIEELILTFPFSYVMARPMANNSCYLVIDSSKDAQLGMLRLAATKYIPKLESSLPGA